MIAPSPGAGSSAGAGTAAVILAAGLGTRMRSGRAKVLHPLGGLPLVTWSVRAVRPLVDRVVVVVGHEREAVMAALEGEGVAFAVQEEQLGTGHALLCAREAVGDAAAIVVLAGDVPRLTTASLRALLDDHAAHRAAATLLTFRASNPRGYGRIIRGDDGTVREIVEEKQAEDWQRAIDECNAALYAFSAADVLPRLTSLPSRGREIYLTDVIEQLVRAGHRVGARDVPEDEVAGINTQAQLAEAEARYRRERADELMESGVTLVDPASVVVEADARVGAGTTLGPFVAIEGRSSVGGRCEIGPLVRLRDARVGDGARIAGPCALVGTDVPAGSVIGSG